MTYLQIVNQVLRLLREDVVAGVNDTTYSTMIADLVNIAKTEIETSFKWNVLRDTITVNTVNGTFRYILTGTGTQSPIIDAYNDTDDIELRKVSVTYMNRVFNGVTSSSSPTMYSINGSDSNGDLQVDVYPVPDGVYNLDFNIVLKQADLSADTDEPLVPSNVVVLATWALAISERGEDGGALFNEIDGQYRQALADAIAIEASNMHPSELMYMVY